MGLRELPPELAKKAQDELNEDPNRIEQDLQALKDWLVKQPHLNARTDDQWLIAFLRGCKYSLERTKEKLDMFYTLRTAAPEMCQVADPMDPTIQYILSVGAALPLENSLNPAEPRLILIRPGQYDTNKISIIDTMQVNHMMSCVSMLEDDRSVVAGQIYMVDLANVTMGHFTQMTPSVAKKMVMSGQEALPIRQKGTHHVNSPAGIETILNFFKSFLNEKNKNRLFIHSGDLETLYKYIPKAILPAEYGGDAGPIQVLTDQWKKKMEDKRDWFLNEMQYKSDESKRLGKPKTVETLFGIEGSFRQLNVD